MSGFEAYRHYENYLHQSTYWPSESDGLEKAIMDMVPRYAASAHAKLLRWAATVSARAHLNIADTHERISFVRRSPLAVALARVAQSLPIEAEFDAVPVDSRDIILAFAPVLAEHTALDITQIFKVAEALAAKAHAEWTMTQQSR